MLSGVSHDLRTPLTRMKLTLALMEDGEETRDLRQDVDQMERMLAEFLAFARGDSLEETVADRPLRARRRRRRGRPPRRHRDRARLRRRDPPRRPACRFAPAPSRARVQNLVGNAARARHAAWRSPCGSPPRALAFVVEDDGPGIPEAERARALQPFTRLDAARNQDAGGSVGLGLTIALDVARSHGGSLELGESADLGGLKATLRLPR